MVKMRKLSILTAACLVLCLSYMVLNTVHASESAAPSGAPRVGNCPVFPPDNAWNRDISRDPVHPKSVSIMSYINGGGRFLGYAFGNWDIYGIPYNIVSGSQGKVPITYRHWGEQSDPGPFPIPRTALVEGVGKVYSDKHVVVIDKDNCKLYELHNAAYNGRGWTADSGAVFNLRSNQLRPDGWTSADAAGLPIFPGLIRYDEVSAGAINHAIRFVVAGGKSRASYLFPARHSQGKNTNVNAAPMGMRVRLKANYDISRFPPQARVILQALKKYGMILADESDKSWVMWGTSSPFWNKDDLETLRQIPSSALEVVVPQYSPAVIAASSTTALKLQYRTGDINATNSTKMPILNVVNVGSGYGVLSELKIRYYYTNENGTTANVDCVSAAIGCDTVILKIVKMPRALPNADHYVEVSFNDKAGTVFAGKQSGAIQLRIFKVNGDQFNEINDYSSNLTLRTLTDWRRVVLYRKGVAIWGAEPGATATPVRTRTPTRVAPRPAATRTPIRNSGVVPTNTPAPRTRTPTRVPTTGRIGISLQYKAVSTNPTDNQIMPAFNLVNTGTVPIRYSDLKVRYWFTRDTVGDVRYRCLSAPMSCARVSGHVYRMTTVRAGAEYYVELTFTADAGYLRPGMQSGAIQINMFKGNLTNFNEANDFSFDGTKVNFAYWPKTALYYTDTKVWGVEPQ